MQFKHGGIVMGRILIDLPDAQLYQLTALAEREQRSPAAVVRDAVDAYIAKHKPAQNTDVFGMWQRRKIDGLRYQQDLRS
jgi:predicted transcriptional regulator